MSVQSKNPNVCWGFLMAGTAGLEPVTSRVTGECSNQLSYAPIDIHRYTKCSHCEAPVKERSSGAGGWNCTADLGLMSPTL